MGVLRALGQMLLAVVLLGSVGGVLLWFAQQDGVSLNVLAWHTPTAPMLRSLGEPPSTAVSTTARLVTPVGWWVDPSATVAPAPPTPTATPCNCQRPATASPTPLPATTAAHPTATPLDPASPWPTDTPATATPVPTRSLVPTAPASATSAGGHTRIGVRANLLIAPADRKRTLDLAADLGVRSTGHCVWIGQQVVWEHFEGVQGQVDWRFLDDAVHEASARGFKLLLSVTKAPAWARQGSRINPSAYGDFVAALVNRYRGQVQAIEVYNEPNLAAEWGGRCDATAYAALLKEAYRRIKAVDSSVIVVSAGLTPTGVNDPYTAIDDVAFLRQVKAAGGLKFCDAVGAHVSGFNNPPEARPGSRCGENPMYGCHASFYVLRYRELQQIAGRKPLWVTECGYASTRDPAPGYEYARDNPEGVLGDYLAATLKLMRGDGIGACFWWNLNYGPTGGEQAAFSLVDRNWSPRAHFRRLKTELGG